MTTVPPPPPSQAGNSNPSGAVDAQQFEAAVDEILDDMRQGACGSTISKTVQLVDLGDGKKAAVIVTITTDEDRFL